MNKIINGAKVIRRNWKKSTLFAGVLTYGASYFKDKFQTHQMMRAYCEEARKYGEKPLEKFKRPKHVTVILNPEANYKKSNVQYEKFAAPLLHLAGFKVSVYQTENEKQAKDLMLVMSNTDAVVIAGGNGTLQEAITGLLLRPNQEGETIPLGIVPLGKTNTIAEYLFGDKSSSRAQLMAEAVMAVIKETTQKLDVLKVQYLDEESPVFAMCHFKQGIFADVDLLVQKYWYLGSLKERFTYFFHSLKEWHPISNARLEYVAPCPGCSRCYVATKQKTKAEGPSRWWHVFLPRTVDTKVTSEDATAIEISTRINENCGNRIELPTEYSNISVASTAANSNKSDKSGSFAIKIFPKDLSIKQFITSGLSHRKSKQVDSTGTALVVDARELTITVPLASEEELILTPETSTLILSTSAESSNPETLDQDNVSTIQTTPAVIQPSTTLSNTEFHSSNETGEVVSLERNTVATSGEIVSADDIVENNLTEKVSGKAVNEPTPSHEVMLATSEELQMNKSSASKETESSKNIEDKELFSYIDHEKYRRASCKISILPKQVTVYG